MARLYLFIIVIGIIGGVGYSAKSYYEWSQETIATLRSNNIQLESAAETLQNTVDQMAADAERNEQLNQNLTRQLAESREYLDAKSIGKFCLPIFYNFHIQSILYHRM